MDNVQKKIIAVGGGGFTHKSDAKLDKFIIDQCLKAKIKFKQGRLSKKSG